MGNAAIAALAMLLLISSHAHAESPSYIEVCSLDTFDDGTGASFFIAAAFMLVALLIGLAYMYSKAKEDQPAGAWAKDEAANLGVSILLFVGLIAFFQASCTVASAYFTTANPFRAADGYLSKLINYQGQNMLRQLTYSSLNNQYEATYYRYYGMQPFTGSGVAEWANLRAHSAHKEFVIDLYLPIMASLNAQRYILQTMQWIGASVLLPFAFIMRLVPFTREFGNMFIAVFFAIYIVVPTAYALGGQAFEEVASLPKCISCSALGPNGVHNFYSYGIDGPPLNSQTWQNAIFYRIGSTLPQAVFLPNLIIIIAITCAMSLSKALRALAV